jgi:hypothetical protein
MRTAFATVGLSVAILFGQSASSSALAPDAVVEFDGGSVSAGIGFSWGNGSLIYHGQRYPLTISGFSVGNLGITQYSAAGTVTGLNSPQDIDGIYTAVSAGTTLGGGGAISEMRNQNGVVIQMTATTAGADMKLAAEGVKISLAK